MNTYQKTASVVGHGLSINRAACHIAMNVNGQRVGVKVERGRLGHVWDEVIRRTFHDIADVRCIPGVETAGFINED